MCYAQYALYCIYYIIYYIVSRKIFILKNLTLFLQIGCTFLCLHTSVQELLFLYWLTTRTFDFCPCVYNTTVSYNDEAHTQLPDQTLGLLCCIVSYALTNNFTFALHMRLCDFPIPIFAFLGYFIFLVKLLVRKLKEVEKNQLLRYNILARHGDRYL